MTKWEPSPTVDPISITIDELKQNGEEDAP
jgi:hypothetical protein